MSSSKRNHSQLTNIPAESNNNKSPSWRKGLLRGSKTESLEPRIMLDAAGVDAANDALLSTGNGIQNLQDSSVVSYASDGKSPRSDATISSIFSHLPLEPGDDEIDTTNNNTSIEQKQELVLVDTSVENYQQLLSDLLQQSGTQLPAIVEPGTELFTVNTEQRCITVIALDTNLSGISAISSALMTHDSLDAVHLLSHGDHGAITIGTDTISQQSLFDNAATVSQWQNAFNPDGDFLLYGCYTANDSTGVAFVNALALQTGADVAASIDPTGHQALGGDWDLEVATGHIETPLITSELAQNDFIALLAASPTTTVDTPAQSFINEPFEFCVEVENGGSDTGFEPYLNVFLEPGVVVNGASYMGLSLNTSNSFTWNGSEWIDGGGAPLTEHPLNSAIPLPGSPGLVNTTWIMIDIPIGSFVPGQPSAKVLFDAELDPANGAAVGDSLDISAQAGFEFGEDASNNPDSDAPIIGPTTTATTTPSVWEIEKEAYNPLDNAVGKEQEQGTGPNNPITYEIRVDIADGQIVDNIVLNDLVPNNIHYLGNLSVSGTGTQINLATSDATIGVHNANQLSVSFDSVTGTVGENDIIINFDGYIPDLDANGVPILAPNNGQNANPVLNEVDGTGNYNGQSISDTDAFEIIPKAVAIQKSNSFFDSAGNPVSRNTVVPGDFVEWTLTAQVSDYFSLDEFIIDDNFSDGQLYVPGTATLEYFSNGVSTGPNAIANSDITLNTIDPATGLTLVSFDVANAIGGTGQLDGDLATDASQTGKTRLVVKFQTQVQEYFQFPGLFGGNSSVDVGDVLHNYVDLTAEVVGTNNEVSDVSTNQINVTTPDASKSIYALNENTNDWDTADPEIAPGQSITYRITIELPTTDVENLVITDFMPLPVFAVHPTYNYAGLFSGVDNVPAPGEFGFGPLTNPADFPADFFDTASGGLDIATVTTNPTSNSIVWDFDSFNQTGSSGGVIDLLFTTQTANIPFEDGYTLTNQSQIIYDNTNNPQAPIASIVQVEPLAPVLALTKGVVAIDAASTGNFNAPTVGPVMFNPAGTAGAAFAGAITSSGIAATPIDSDLSDVDAGDTVRFAITVENSGGFSATDITINDDFPSGFAIPAGGLNLQAALGDGTVLGVTGSLFDAAGTPDVNGISIQSGGSELNLGAGRVDSTVVDDGSNILVVTYDLVVDTSAATDSTLLNNAELLTFAAVVGSADYTEGNTNNDWNDDASVQIVEPSVTKELVSSGIDNPNNPLNEAVPGEYVNYRLTIQIPEGSTPVAEIRDLLDSGFAFDSLTSVTTSSADITTDLVGGFAGITAPANGSTGVMKFNLGNITNANTDNATPETLVLEYRVYVIGTATDGRDLDNRADFRWDNDGDGKNPSDGRIRVKAPEVEVITPKLNINKSIVGADPIDVGDPITYEIVITHTAASDTDAFNTSFSDVFPSELTGLNIVSIVDGGIGAAAGFTLTGNTLTNPDFNLALGESITITVAGTVASATTGQAIANTAEIDWTTLDNTDPIDGVDAVEPTYSDSDSAEFTVAPPEITKSIISTGINTANNSNTQVVQGEFVIYRVELKIPEGSTPFAELIDTLPANMSYDNSFTPTVTLNSADLATSNPGIPPTVTGQDVSFNFGTIKNSNNNNPAPETITVDYRVFVNGGNSGDTLTNNAKLLWDVDGDNANTGPTDGSVLDSVNIDVLAPVLEVDKNVTAAPSDAGDNIEYTILIKHATSSNTDAYEATFSDTIPSEIDNVAVVTALDSANNPVSGFTVTGNTITNSDFDLALNESITLVISGEVSTTASASSSVINIANINWDTLGDDAQGIQSAEGSSSATDNAQFVVASPVFEKSVLSTGINDSSNNNTQVVAGEFVTYQLVVTVPEGTTPLAEITDALDTDLLFDPTFTITAVSSSGVTFNGPATTPTITPSNITFNLGTIVNTDIDNSVDDTVTITYRVYADADVVPGDALPNNATLIWDGDDDGDNTDPEDGSLSDDTTVTVIAPELEIEKSITTMPQDVGDTIVYDVLIKHSAASNASAMDVVFSDTLPSEIDAVSVTAVDSTGATVTGFVITSGATQDTISNPEFNLALNDFVRLTITGTVNSTASASTAVLNTADISWDTLDDDAAVDGYDNNPDPADNVQASGSDSDDAEFVVASPTFSKSILSTGINDASNNNTQVVAGEFVTYQLIVTVPEGTTQLAQITDTLDADLIFDPTFAITAVGSSGVTFNGTATTPTVAGSNVTFNLGDIVNSDIDNAVDDTVTITYRVYADADVVLGDALPNNATLIWDGDDDGDNTDPDDGSLSDDTTVTVIAPELEIEKSITTMPQDVGDTIVYDVLIKHTAASNAGAMDVVFSDTLPLEIDAVSVTAVDSTGASVPSFVITSGATQDTISNPEFNLGLNDFVQLTITGTVNDTASASTTVLNTADISWDTLDDDAPVDGFDNNPDPADNVQASGSDSDDAEFVVASPTFSKSILSTGINDAGNNNTHVVAGEFVTYQLIVTVPEGTTPLAEITDTLDTDLLFDPTFTITAVGSSGVTFNGPATTPTVAGSNVTFSLGHVVNTDIDNAVDDTVTITYRVYADADVTLGDVLPNNAALIWDGDDDGDNIDPEDGSLSDGTSVTVISPEIEIEKTITTIPNDSGDTVVYDVMIKHTAASNAGAMDLVFSDVLPAEIDAVSVTAVDNTGATVTGFVIVPGATQDTISNPDFNLALNDFVQLTITGTVNATASASTTVVNTADISWDTLDDDAVDDGYDNNPDPADNIQVGGSDTDDAQFVMASPTFEKSILSTGINDAGNNNTQVVAGEFVTYQLIVTVPEGTTQLAQITDTLDTDLIFDPTFAITAVGSSGVTFNGPATTPTVAGSNVTFNLGDIVNTDVDDSAADTVTITYRVYADADVVLGNALPNNATLIWDGDDDGDNTDPEDGSLSDDTTVTVIAPELEIEKTITTVPNDGGDTVVYDVLIKHTTASNAGALDVVFSDTLPSEIDAVSVTAVDSAGATVPGFVIVPGTTQDTISNPDFNLALNDIVQLTITGTVNATASASTTVVNTAEISWDTLDDDAVDGFDNNPDPADNVQVGGSDTDDAQFVMASPTFTKSILNTGINDSSNNNTQVVAGEFVTYQLIVTVPEGTTQLAQITDTLDADLLFDPTFAITAVGSSGVTFNGPATTPTVAGSNVTFDLGDIVNTDVDDSAADTVTITYRVYADADVTLGDVLPNNATLIWDGDDDGDNTDPEDGSLSDDTTVTVIAPELEIEKSITTTPNDGGDTIVYDVLIQHTAASNAGAMDVVFSDVLPSELDAVSVTAVDSTGTSVPGFVIVPGATQDTISNPDFNLALNDFVQLTITGTVNSTASASTTILNTADISWDTLDDDATADGYDNNPDPADNVQVGGSDSDNAAFVMASPTFDKVILSTGINDLSNNDTQVVAGEFVTYQLIVTVPEGTTQLAQITDALDTDLIFDPTFTVTAVGSSGVSFNGPATTPTVAGSNVTFDLGDIVNINVDDSAADTVTITYRVYADADVVLGNALPNNATLIWDGDNDGDNTDPEDGSLADGTSVTVISPEIEIEKTITTIPNDGGDTVVYDLLIKHTPASNAGAMDVVFSDVLPSEIDAVSVTAVDSAGTSVPGFVIVPGATQDTISNPDFNLALNDFVQLTITGTVNATASASTTVLNTADISWDTLDNDAVDDGYDNNPDPADNVQVGGSDSDDAQFVMASPTFAKSILSTGINDSSNSNTQVVAGEFVTYQLVVTVPEGTTQLAQITDTLDADLVFDPTFSITAVGSSGVTFNGPATTPTVAGSNVTFDLGDIVNTDVDDSAADTVTITYRVYADADVTLGDVLPNNATLIWDGDDDGDNTDPEDGSLADGTNVTVIGTELLVNKSVTQIPSDVGDQVTYEIVIRHTTTADAPITLSQTTAYDVTLNDNLPAGLTNLTIDSAVDSANNPITGFNLAGNTLNHSGFDLALNDTVTITVSGIVGPSVAEGDTITNVANINWTSLDSSSVDGNDAAETNESADDSADFSIGDITKSVLSTGINDASNDNTEAVTGEFITYQLVVDIPQGTSPVAEIEDVLDAGLVFDTANGVSVTPSSANLSTNLTPGDFSNTPVTYNNATNTISIDLGDISNTATAGTIEQLTLTYRVYVDDDSINSPEGTLLNNTAEFKWDINGDGSNDGVDDGSTVGSAPDVTVTEPELEVIKKIASVPQDAGDTIIYDVLIQHTSGSTAGANDVLFTDLLPPELDAVSVTAADSSGTAVPGFVIVPGISQDTITNPDFNVALNDSVRLTITGTLNTTVSASTTVLNTAQISWDTLDDDAPVDGFDNNADPADNVQASGNDSDDADFIVASPTFEKSIFSTGINDSSNNNTQVVAGEYVTYQLTVTAPEGTTPLAKITDVLDADLLFDPGFAITAVGSNGVTFSGPATVPTVAGSNITFDLGTIINTNVDDAVDDTVIITYRVYADADVTLGDALPNNATFVWDANTDGDNTDPEDGSLTDGTSVTVISPEIQIEKTITTIPNDGGDTVVYDVMISHTAASTAGAMDIAFSDALPSEIDAVSVTAVNSAGTSVPGFVIVPGANQDTVSNPDFNLALNDFVRLTITGTVNATASASTTISNTADISWDTLDDDAAEDGYDNNPAPADNVQVGGSDSDNAAFVMALPTFDKVILSTGINDSSNSDTQVVAGEFVTYQLIVTAPEGTTQIAQITDTLDADLIFDPTFTITAVGSSGVSFNGPATTPTVAGSNVTFELGDIVNTNVDDSAADTVTITYRVYAHADVVLGDALPNNATLIWDADNDGDNTDPDDGSLNDGTSVTVISPEIEIEKTITTIPNDSGDTVVYDVMIKHTAASTAGAMDIDFSDVLPSEIDAVSVTAVSSTGTTVPGFIIIPGATQDTISNPNFNLALNDFVQLTITGTVNATASASTIVTNTADISWDTLDDEAPEDGFDNNPDPADNVQVGGSDSDDADFIVASPTFKKVIASTGINDSSNNNTQVVAGEFVTYQLIVSVPEGTTPLAEITDTLDADLIFDPTFAITAVGSSGVTLNGPAITPTVAGANVTFSLGSVINTNVDDTVDDTVTITYRVYADADVILGDTLPNNATFLWDADNDGDNTDPEDGSLSDGTSVTVISPEIQIEKTITTIPSDGGDTVVYDVMINHTAASNAGAMDIDFSDVLPPEIDAVSVTAVDSSGASVAGFVIVPGATQDTISNPDFNLALNDFVQLTITGTVNATAPASTTVLNTANISWDTLDDDAAEDGYDNNLNPANNVQVGGSDSDDAAFVMASPIFNKVILSTGINDSSNNDTQVVAGEFVTYQLIVTVPEGTTPLAEITDVLDADLLFDPGFAITAVGSNGVTFNGPATTPTVAGSNITFDLGTIVNTDVDDSVDDTVTITYRVYADAAVTLGDALPNNATFVWDADNDGDNTDTEDGSLSDGTSVTVISPEIEIEKTITTIPEDGGDTIVYDVLIKHTAASTAGAMDIDFSDVLPSEIDAVSVTAVDSTGASVPGFVIVPGITQDTISNPDFNLALNNFVQLTITGTVNATAAASTTVVNTADISWDTLDDNAPEDGFDNNTNTADNVQVGGNDSDDAEFVIATPTFAKSILSTGINGGTNNNTQVVAGEFVTYQLVVNAPEGTTPLSQINDVLDADLVFDPTFPITAVGSSGVTFNGPATIPVVSGSNVTFDIGTIVNANVDDSINDTVTITYRVYADADVTLGDTLPNNATLLWDADNDGDNTDPEDGTLSDGTTVTVIGTELLIEKNVTQIPSDTGDAITYEILIRHTTPSDAPITLSQTTAYDVTLSDNLPAGLTNLIIDSAVDSANNPIAGFNLTGNTLSHTGFDLALGETVTVTVSAVVGPTVIEGDTITNVADINWTSLDGDSDDGNDAVETVESTNDSADFTIGDITKTVLSTGVNDASNDNTEAVTGEFITYQLVVDIPQGTSPIAEIEDVLDAGLVFDTANGVTVTPSSTNLNTSLTPGDFSNVQASYDASNNRISIALGNITNTAPAGTAESLTLTYRVFVDNDNINAPVGATLNNSVDFKWDIDGDGNNDGPDDGTTQAASPDITIIAPELQVNKTIIDTPVDAGDSVTYAITIEHTTNSQAAAFDASFSDVLPPEISNASIVSVLDSASNPVAGFSVDNNTVSNADFDLALGDHVVVTVTGTLNTTASASTTITNTANITWDTLGDNTQGNQSVEDGGNDLSSDSFVVASPKFKKLVLSTGINDADNNHTQVVAGEFVVYDLVVTVPEGTTPMAQITDTLNSDLIFDQSYPINITTSSGVSISGSATTPTVGSNTVQFDLGTIVNTDSDDGVADTVVVTYRVYTDTDVALGDVLDNNATFIWDADNDGENTATNDGVLSDQTNVTVLAPNLVIEKSVTQVPADVGDTIEYTFVIRHTDNTDTPLSASNATAYDIEFNDNLPNGIVNASVLSAVDSSGASVAGFTTNNTFTASSVNNASFDLPVDETVTVTVLAEVSNAIVEGDTIVNTANILWGTLDADSDDGLDSSEAYNSAADSTDFSIANVEKRIVGTGINDAFNDQTEAVTGEYIHYQVVVEVPQGKSATAELIDTLDAGLIFDSTQGVTITPSSSNLSTNLLTGDFSTIAATYDQALSTVSVPLGNIINTAPAGSIETLTLDYRVYVANDSLSAPTGAKLNNSVDFRWDIDGDGNNNGLLDGTTEDSANPVTVTSPDLEVTKDIISMPSETGDLIRYQFTVQHTIDSQASAYDVNFLDILPAGISIAEIDSVSGSGTPITGFDLTGNTLTNTSFDLALGESVTVVVSGIIAESIDAGDTITNTAGISWSSLDAGNPTDGADAYNSNNERYNSDADSATFSVADIHKSIVSTGITNEANTDTQVVNGEYITYQIVVDIPQGSTPVANISDTLDAGLAFDSLISVVPSSVNLNTNSGTGDFSDLVAPAQGATGNINFALGDIVNSNADNTVTESLTLTYRVYVTNANLVSAGISLDNLVELAYDTNGDGTNNSPGDGSTTDAAPNVTVLEPILGVTKTVDDTLPHLGQTVTYTVVVSNNATPLGTDAMDVNISDDLPAGMIFHPSSIMVNGDSIAGLNTVANNSAGNALNLALDKVALGSSTVITYQATVSSDTVDFGATLTNTVNIDWSSLSSKDSEDGSDNNERDHSDGYSTLTRESLTLTAPDYAINKSSSNNGPLRAGDAFTYTVTVSNLGTHEGTGIVVTDEFPVIALGTPVTISDGGEFDAQTGRITWNIAELAINESVTFTVDVAVLENLTPDIDGNSNSLSDTFTNSVSVTDDEKNGQDPNSNNNQTSDTDEIIATPDYSITKTNDIEMAAPTSQFTYVIEADNHGTQAGTGVEIIDTYPTDILTVIDADGGSIDATAGTITWQYPTMNVGDSVTLNVLMEVLPTANLDTSDQLFHNQVSISDDGNNGPDGTPDDNTDSHSDMLLAGAGEPMLLAATPESATGSNAWLGLESSAPDAVLREDSMPLVSEPRYITHASMTAGNQSSELFNRSSGLFNDDLIRDGHLLNTYSLDSIELSEECAVHYTRDDVSPEDLLSSEPTDTKSKPWAWLEDLPDVAKPVENADHTDGADQPKWPANTLPQNETAMLKDNTIDLPITKLDSAQSLFQSSNSTLKIALADLPDRSIPGKANTNANEGNSDSIE